MIYKKSQWLINLFYIFLIVSSEGCKILQYFQSPQIIVTDVQHDVLKFNVHVPNDCQPKVWLEKEDQPDEELSPVSMENNRQTWKYAKMHLKPKAEYGILVEGCHISQPYVARHVSTRCKPLEIILPLNPSNDSVNITFRNDKEFCLPSNYHFRVSHNAFPHVIMVGLHEIVRINNLIPDTEYELSGEHMSYNNNMTYWIQKKFRTKKSDVLPPKIYFALDHIGDNNKYYFKWNVTNQGYFGVMTTYIIKWRFHFKACSSQTFNYAEDKERYHFNKTEAEIILKPYSEYSFLLDVYGSEKQIVNNSLKYSQPILTKFEENFIKDEIPVMNNFETTKTDIKVIFKDLNCTKLQGPMYLNYKAIGEEDWCESIALKHKSVSLKFPWEHNNTISIPFLTPYCTYNVTFYVSRESDKWENATSLEPFTASTKSEVIANPIEDLLVTSKGKSHISFRWKLSPKPNGPLKEYKINFVGGTKGAYTAEINRTVRPCRLWPDYQCHNFKENLLQNDVQYNISIIPINENNLDNEQLLHEIETHSKSIQNINVVTKEAEPKEPYDVEAKFIDHNKINVSWKHPNETNGILTFFNVWVLCNYENSEEDKNNIAFLLYSGTEDYKLNYFQVTDVSCSPKKHIKSVDISVVAHNTISRSKSVKIPVLEPPLPYRYNGHITFSNLVMKITKPNLDAFFNELFIFIAEHKKDKPYNEGKNELQKIQELLETLDNKSINETCKINRLIGRFARGDKSLSQDNISINGSNGLFKYEIKYKITVFITNKLNEFRKVSHITLSAKSGKKESKEEDKFHSWTILQIISTCSLFVLLFLVYIIYRIGVKKCKTRAVLHRLSKNEYADPEIIFSSRNDNNPVIPKTVSLEKTFMPFGATSTWDTICPGDASFQTVHSRRIEVDNFFQYIENVSISNEIVKQYEEFLEEETELLKTNKNNKRGVICQTEPSNSLPVVLHEFSDGEYWTHVDASFIDGYKKPKAYIVMQDPKRTSLLDFWRTMWQEKVTYIITIGSNKMGMYQYWPDDANKKIFIDKFTIAFIGNKSRTYDCRKFSLCYKQFNPRKIYQLHFKEWPDQGIPQNSKSLLPILKQMQSLHEGDFPILVHCSDGVGKTGSLLLCDICLRMAASEGVVDVLAILEHLRNQRHSMVNTAEQYRFAHFVILNYLMKNTNMTVK